MNKQQLAYEAGFKAGLAVKDTVERSPEVIHKAASEMDDIIADCLSALKVWATKNKDVLVSSWEIDKYSDLRNVYEEFANARNSFQNTAVTVISQLDSIAQDIGKPQ